MDRRAFLAATAAAVITPLRALAATPESEDFVQKDLVLDGDKRIAKRALVLIPKHVAANEKLRVLVLLHGLGETGNEILGIHAWGERYGLVRAYERLRRPPVSRELTREKYFTDEHLQRTNKSLTKNPFSGLVMVCPVTPNPYKLQPANKTLDSYTDWIEKTLLPAVYDKTGAAKEPENTGLDGCSLGGYVSLEVFLRKPH